MEKKSLLTNLLVMIALSACQQATPQPEIDLGAKLARTELSTATITATAVGVTSTHVSTPVVISPSATISLESSPTVAPNAEIIERQKEAGLVYQCTDVFSEPIGFQTDLVGSLVLESTKPGGDSSLFQLGTGQRIPLPSFGRHSFYNLSVSPNQNWLAYGVYSYDESKKEVVNQLLVITDTEGQSVKQIDAQASGDLATWLDDEQLIFYRDDAVMPFQTGLQPISIVLNPFTGDQKTLPSDSQISTIGSAHPWNGRLSVLHAQCMIRR